MALLNHSLNSGLAKCVLRCARRRMLFVTVAVLLFPLRFAAQTSHEVQIKGVLLLHLTQFVEWPASSFESEKSEFVIGVCGEDPFDKTLDEIVRGEKVGTHQIRVQRFPRMDSSSIEQARKCQLLFFAGSEKDWRKVITKFESDPVLTVSDSNNFIRDGGMIHMFKTGENKIRLRINLERVKSCGMTVSSKLLRVADVVQNSGQ